MQLCHSWFLQNHLWDGSLWASFQSHTIRKNPFFLSSIYAAQQFDKEIDKQNPILPAEGSVMGVWKQWRSTGGHRHSDRGWWELLAVLHWAPVANTQGEQAPHNTAGNWGRELTAKTGCKGEREKNKKQKREKENSLITDIVFQIMQATLVLQNLCLQPEKITITSVLLHQIHAAECLPLLPIQVIVREFRHKSVRL